MRLRPDSGMGDNGTIYHIGISGGKDSDAVMLWMVYESGIPIDQIRSSFCDTGNEVESTYEHIEKLSREIMPIKILKPEMGFYELAAHKGRFPSAKARFCTEFLKIRPTMTYVQELQSSGYEVVLVSGVRAAESFERSGLPEREWDGVYDCEHWRPLLTWSLEDVWAIHEKYGIEPNPLYARGMKRVGCAPCVMSRKAEIATMAQVFPERIDRIRDAETQGTAAARGGCTFFSPNKVPLRYRSHIWQRPGTEGMITEALSRDTVEIDTPGKLLDIKPSGKEGRPSMNRFALAMIDDVVQWATDESLANEAQTFVDFDNELETVPSCASRWGLCE